jgi:hypothetical protein
MPRHKQPDSLIQLALKSIADFVWHMGQQLIELAVVSEYYGRESFFHSINPSTYSRHGVPESSRHLFLPQAYNYNWDALHQFLQPGLPQALANKVASYILDTLTRLLMENEYHYYNVEMVNHDTGVGAIEMLISAAIYPRMFELVLHHRPEYLCYMLCKQLHRLTELKVLKIRAIPTKSIKIAIRDLVGSSVGSLRKLVVFVYDKNCTDSILEVMSQNCMQLENLNVMFSKKVTVQSVDSIKKFQNLKVLNIWGTFITKYSCSQLLDALTKLEYFSSDQEDSVQGVTKHTLGLKSLITTSLKSVHLLVNLCPHLTQLTLYAVHCNLIQLTALTSLHELTISNCDFSVIETFLLSRGEQLILLNLQEVSSVNMKSITYCTHLKTLHLSVCKYTTDRNMPFGDLSSLHYKNVEHLNIRGYHFSNFDILMSAYTKLKTLNLCQVPVLGNEVIVNAVTAGKWKYLEILSFNDCGHVEIETLKYLVNSCCNLRKIIYKGIRNPWRGELLGLYILEQHLKQNNLDIEIVS